MSDFSDRPFVAGSLFGLRAFRVDSLGRLTGVTHKSVWTPGENNAECRAKDAMPFSLYSQYISVVPSVNYDPQTGFTYTMPSPTTKAPEIKTCTADDLVSLKCGCGFYAYFDGGNDYEESEYVSGVVEGYGRCVVGNRGFRAGKSRIVALIRPARLREERDDVKSDLLWTKVLRNYAGVPSYDSVPEAISNHPLTEVAAPNPETDEDFWTRSAS